VSAPDRRRRAALAGHRGDAAEARALLVDDDPAVRAAALGALARCGSLDATTLAGAAGDPHPAVRRRAAEELAALGPTRPGDVGNAVDLAALLGDDDPGVAEAASFAAGERHEGTSEPPEDVVAALHEVARHHPDALCREAAVAALGAWGRPADLDPVLAATTGKPALRRRSAVALAAFVDDPRAVEALRRLAGDRDWQVREVAEVLLEDLSP
jgi:HEAT repeat protein